MMRWTLKTPVWLPYKGSASNAGGQPPTQPLGTWSWIKPLSPYMPAPNDDIITDRALHLGGLAQTSFIKPHQMKQIAKDETHHKFTTSSMQDNFGNVKRALQQKRQPLCLSVTLWILSIHPLKRNWKLIWTEITAAAVPAKQSDLHLESRGQIRRVMATTTV